MPSRLTSARRDLIVIAVLIGSAAIFLLNSNSLLWTIAAAGDGLLRESLTFVSVALIFNVALILFG